MPVQAGDDAADARWFRLSRAGTLPNVQLTLACGDIQLVAELRAEVYDAPCGRIYNISVINAGDIAFDHAAIVLRACLNGKRCSAAFDPQVRSTRKFTTGSRG